MKGFAYIDLSTARLAEVLAVFRGSQWKGQRFRVEAAKESYLVRLQQQWQAEQAQQHQPPPPPSAPVLPPPSVDWSTAELCFRVRPGHRIRVRPRPSHRDFTTIAALPLEQLPLPESPPSPPADAEGAEEASEAELQSLHDRLQRWKAEVEQRWVKDQPKRDTSKRSLSVSSDTARAKHREREEKQARSARTEKEEEVEEDGVRRVFDIPAEEELGTVDFLSDEEGAERVESEDEQELTEEERRKREEDADWATLEASAVADDSPQSPLLPHPNGGLLKGAPNDDAQATDDREWADLEGEGDKTEEAEADRAPPPPSQVRRAVPSFPKKSVREWFEDEDEDGVSTGDAAEGRMEALSSALVSSTSEFDIRPAYEGKSGQRLLQMKRKFAGDTRFALDDRFADAAKDEEVERRGDNDEEEEERKQEEGLGMEDSGFRGDGVSEQQQRDAELKRALHAETLRALQVLDEVAPGPSKFHQTLPRFSSITPSTPTDGALDAAKDAQAVESELNAAEARKAVLRWRRIDRYDPDVEDRKHRRLEGQRREEGGEERKHSRATEVRKKAASVRQEGGKTARREGQREAQRVSAEKGEARASEVEEEQLRFSRSFSVEVPRLRDLVTDPSTVVQFSFAVPSDPNPPAPLLPHHADAEVQTNIDTAPAFPTKLAPPSQPPLITAPVGLSPSSLLLQRRAADSIPIPTRAPAATAPLPPPAAAVPSDRPRSLRDLLALAAQVHEGVGGVRRGEVGRDAAGSVGLAVEEDEEEEGGGFMRGEGEDVEVAWRRSREAVRLDYKKKSREAGKKEAIKQAQALQRPMKRKQRGGGTSGGGDGGERGGKHRKGR